MASAEHTLNIAPARKAGGEPIGTKYRRLQPEVFYSRDKEMSNECGEQGTFLGTWKRHKMK